MTRTQQANIPLALPVGFTVRLLDQDDLFGDEHWKTYIDGCEHFLLQCFKSDFASAVGAFVDNRLAYITWALYDHVEINGKLIPAKGVATEWNVYCLPEFRGRGLHSYVKAWSVNEMLRNGAKKCVSVTLAYNRPALKAQYNCGFSIENTFYLIKIGKKKIIRGKIEI